MSYPSNTLQLMALALDAIRVNIPKPQFLDAYKHLHKDSTQSAYDQALSLLAIAGSYRRAHNALQMVIQALESVGPTSTKKHPL